MRRRTIIKESELRQIVKEAVEEELGNKSVLDETSRRQKAEKAIKGTNKNVKTFAILTPENPMAQSYTPEQNKEARDKFEKRLRIGGFQWFPIKGQYAHNSENSYIIYNIPLDDALWLGNTYHQEAIIYVVPDLENREIHAEYWAREEDGKPLKRTYSKDSYIDATNDEDMWSQISRKFKFRFPFFEQIARVSGIIDEHRQYHGDGLIDSKLRRIVKGGNTGWFGYYANCALYGRME